MDLTVLAASVLPVLLPYIPIIATKAAERIGEALPDSVSKLWGTLAEKFAKKEASKEALDDLIKHPDDPDAQATFRVQLRKIAQADPDFHAALVNFLDSEQGKSTNISSQKGTGNISVQGTNNSVSQSIGQIGDNITQIGYQPKQIPAEQATQFVMAMRAVRPPGKVHVTYNLIDPQTSFLAKQLTDLLQKAGWDVSGDSSTLATGPKGIIYDVPASADSTAVDQLATFLQKLGFLNYKQINPNAKIITILVNGV